MEKDVLRLAFWTGSECHLEKSNIKHEFMFKCLEASPFGFIILKYSLFRISYYIAVRRSENSSSLPIALFLLLNPGLKYIGGYS
jgi:hypothetical protein